MNIKHTILMITYNQENFIRNAIESALNQTIKPYEIVISDDCSSDNTFEIISRYKKEYPNLIRVNRNDKNLGIHGNVKKILGICSGNVVSFCAGDDTLEKNMVERVNNLIYQNDLDLEKDNFVIISNTLLLYPDGHKDIKYNYYSGFNFFKAMIRKHYSFIKIGISKKVFENSEYPSDIGLWADWAWDVNIASKVDKVIFTNEYFYNYTIGSGITSKTKQEQLVKSYIDVSNYILKKHKDRLDFTDKLFLHLEKASCNYQLDNSFVNYIKFLLLFIVNINNIGTKAGIKSYVAKLLPGDVVTFIKRLKK